MNERKPGPRPSAWMGLVLLAVGLAALYVSTRVMPSGAARGVATVASLVLVVTGAVMARG